MIYRSPAEMIEETREQVKNKFSLFKWLKTNYALITIYGILVLLVMSMIFAGLIASKKAKKALLLQEEQEAKDKAWADKLKQDRLTGDCSLFGHEKMADIPARCIPYFQNNHQQ